jgi:hypothetical protein
MLYRINLDYNMQILRGRLIGYRMVEGFEELEYR